MELSKMANRYTKTGYTSREIDTLKRFKSKILTILSNRAGKNDSSKAFQYLLSASDRIGFALNESERWKNS